MKINKILFSVLLIVWNSLTMADIINIPDDYPTIQQGIDASVNGDIVLAQPGVYYENINFNGHNITLGSLFFTTGDSSYISSTIIDGGLSGTVIRVENQETYAAVSGMTIQNGRDSNSGGIYCRESNVTITDCRILANETYGFGGGVHCDSNSYIELSRNIIAGNSSDWGGGGLYIENSDALINRNVISGNSVVAFGGGLLLNAGASAELYNNSFSDNFAFYGGGISIMNNSHPIIISTIFWGDSSFTGESEIYMDGTSSPSFAFCDVQNVLLPGIGNISVDPLFRDPEGGDYHLMATACGDNSDSPCIDAGDPSVPDSLLDCYWGLGTLISDMGAFGGWEYIMIGIEHPSSLPNGFALMQNFPNPFNASTVIEFQLPEASNVMLTVYDLLGREVDILIDNYMLPGVHTAIFDASSLPSGIYLYRLQTDNQSSIKKMILLK